MILQYAFTFLLCVACLLQFAVDQAPDLPESHDNKAARRVLIAGLFVMSALMVRNCLYGILGEPLWMFGLFLIVLAEIAFCLNRLFPEFSAAIVRTSILRRNRPAPHRETWQ